MNARAKGGCEKNLGSWHGHPAHQHHRSAGVQPKCHMGKMPKPLFLLGRFFASLRMTNRYRHPEPLFRHPEPKAKGLSGILRFAQNDE